MTPLEKSKQEASQWQFRIQRANDNFKKWETRFRTKVLDKYYEGKQWRNDGDPTERAYVFNLFYSTVAIKSPKLTFKSPAFQIHPRPNSFDYNPEEAFAKASMAQDTLNSLISQQALEVGENFEDALLDSFFWYGVAEVGYSADWVMNPNAGKPAYKADYNPDASDDAKILREPDEVPQNERIYIKHIPADQFRVGSNVHKQLTKQPWVGYYEWVRAADLRAKGSGIEFPNEIPVSNQNQSDDFIEDETPEAMEQSGSLVKIWKIWDLRAKKQIIYIPCANTVTVVGEFKRLPVFGLRYSRRTKGWYPIPLAANWISPQDEINESKEQLRIHRRRTKRVFQIKKGGIEPEEMDKLVHGADGTVVEIKDHTSELKPVMMPQVDGSVLQAMQISNVDFNVVAAVSANERGQVARTTATEIESVNAYSTVREKSEREVVAEWMAEIGREVLLQAIEKLVEPIWIKINTDSAWGDEYNSLKAKYQMIQTDYLNGIDYQCTIHVASISPLANEEESQAFIKFVTLLTQFPVLGLNPGLIRQAAFICGFRNETVIRQLMEAAQLQMIGQIEMGKMQLAQVQAANSQMGGSGVSGAGGGNPMQQIAAEQVPPGFGQAQNDMNAAVTGGLGR